MDKNSFANVVRNRIAYLSSYLAHGDNLVQLEPLLKELKEAYSEMNGFELRMRFAIIQAWYC